MADIYPLDRGLSESQRLHDQHNLWIKLLGNHYIHPTLTPQITSTSRIADIATGTGAWLIGLSHQLPPTCKLDGFDISNTQFPLTNVPDNVSLSIHNAKLPFPLSLQGQYDLVNLRFLVTAMDNDDWAVVAANVVKLLKPGGCIQWMEPDTVHAETGSHAPNDASNIKMVVDGFNDAFGYRFEYGYRNLPGIFERVGMSQVSQHALHVDRDNEESETLTRVTFAGLFGWAVHATETKARGAWSLDEMRLIRQGSEREMADGAFVHFNVYVTVGSGYSG